MHEINEKTAGGYRRLLAWVAAEPDDRVKIFARLASFTLLPGAIFDFLFGVAIDGYLTGAVLAGLAVLIGICYLFPVTKLIRSEALKAQASSD